MSMSEWIAVTKKQIRRLSTYEKPLHAPSDQYENDLNNADAHDTTRRQLEKEFLEKWEREDKTKRGPKPIWRPIHLERNRAKKRGVIHCNPIIFDEPRTILEK